MLRWRLKSKIKSCTEPYRSGKWRNTSSSETKKKQKQSQTNKEKKTIKASNDVDFSNSYILMFINVF